MVTFKSQIFLNWANIYKFYETSIRKIYFLKRYGGHVPTVNYQYGETFGRASQKYFNDYRYEVLNSSKSLYSRGGYFPTSVSNNPELAINQRRRERDRDLFNPRSELNNYHYDRTKNLNDFYRVCLILFTSISKSVEIKICFF